MSDDEEQMLDISFNSVWVKTEVEEDVKEEIHDAKLPLTFEQSSGQRILRSRKQKAACVPQLKCDVCNYETANKSSLQNHMLSHTTYKPLSCNVCSYRTKYSFSLQRHKLQHTEENVTFNCDKCDYNTMFKSNLKAHKRKHTKKRFDCNDCEFSTTLRHNIIKHSKVHRQEIFKCDKCPYVTKFDGHIIRHKAKIHNEASDMDFKCENCNFATKNKWRLNMHIKKYFTDNEIKCKHCDFTTKHLCDYNMHSKANHKSIIKCDEKISEICTLNNEYTTNEELASANDYEYPKRPYSPQLEFDKSNKFMIDTECVDWKHIPVNKAEGQEKPFHCTKCDYSSKYKASVQRHFERHHTDKNKPYKCINCDFSTKTKDQIALHNARSQSADELSCKHCPFTTNFKCYLALHQKKHYPYKCKHCDYTCKHIYAILRHNAVVHRGQVIKCEFCEFTTGRKESMACHLTKHTGVKRYKCDLCDYSCMRPCLLASHKRKHESTEEIDVKTFEDFESSLSYAYNAEFDWDGISPSPMFVSTPNREL